MRKFILLAVILIHSSPSHAYTDLNFATSRLLAQADLEVEEDIFTEENGTEDDTETGNANYRADEGDDELDGDFVEAEMTGSDTDEPQPKAEFPYPGAREEGFAENRVNAPPPPPMTERPKRIDDEGNYYYDTSRTEPKFSGRAGVPSPRKTSKAGEFYYEKPVASPFSNREGVEAPLQITESGQFLYATEQSPQSNSASVRIGIIQPPDIQNADTGLIFADIYSNENLPVFLADYEWRITSSIGRLGLKFGSGIMTAQGQGQFKTVDGGRRTDDTPEERFTFFMLPNQLTAIYRFQYSDTQIFVPFIEGGAGYFTFIELRDDNAKPKFGGAATTVVAGGVNILLDWVDRKSVRQLDAEYGINHVWLTGEYRQIIGLSKTYDFTSGVANLGVMFDF